MRRTKRQNYAATYGPIAGDYVQLADTDLWRQSSAISLLMEGKSGEVIRALGSRAVIRPLMVSSILSALPPWNWKWDWSL